MSAHIIFLFILIFGFLAPAVPAQTGGRAGRQISLGVVNGKAVSLPEPEYPAAARAVEASGAVNFRVTIDENGEVISAAAVSGHPLLRQAAEKAARQAPFTPTILSGQAVKVTGVIVYNFLPAGLPPAAAARGHEEKLAMMGLAAFLVISDRFTAEEWDVIRREELESTPEIAAELLPLASITKTMGKEERHKILTRVIASLENKLRGGDAWQFSFGKEFGQMMLLAGIAAAGEPGRHADDAAIKIKLIKMRDLLPTAPADIPPDVLSKFKELVEYADAPDLTAGENQTRFIELIVATLNTIAPDKMK